MASDAYSSLSHNLSRARRLLTWVRVGLWLVKALSVSAAALLLLTLVVWLAGAESPITPVLSFASVYGIPALLLAAVIVALARAPRLDAVAVMADNALPGNTNILVSALQLGRRAGELASFYSSQLIDAVVKEGAAASRKLQPSKLLPLREIQFWTRNLAVTGVALAAFLVFVPGALRPSFSALMLAAFEKRAPVLEPVRVEAEPISAPPQVSEFTITYQYPGYSGMERRVVRTIVGDVSALRGTAVGLDVEFTQEVTSAALSFNGGTRLKLEPQSGKRFYTSFALMRKDTYSISMRNEKGDESVSPVYSVEPQEDLVPFVKLVRPAPDVELDESMELPLEIVSADDYGLSVLYLYYFTDPAHVLREEIRRFKPRTRETALTHFWNVALLQLLPGESVSYFVEVLDNDQVSGPKAARTPVMTARFPTIAELYAGMEEEHAGQIVDLEQLLEDAQTVKQELDRVSREMKQEDIVSWERKKEVEGLGRTSMEILEDVERLSHSLEEDIHKLENYSQANWELADKIQELASLLEEIKSPELKSAMERLQEAISRLDSETIAAAMEELSLTQEELLQGLDRAIELLKQIKQDEELRGLVEEALRLAEKETEINRQLGGESPNLDRARQEQSDISQALEQLSKDISELSEEASDAELAEMLKEASRSIQRGGLRDMMEQSSAMMRSRNSPTLRRLMRQIETQLFKLADDLASAEQRFSSGRAADITEKVRRSMHELLDLSKAQEELAACTGREPSADLALRQQKILDGTKTVTDRLFELSKETPFMTYRISTQLGEVLREMERALRSYEGKKTEEGLRGSGEALSLVNNVLMSLLVAEQTMCSGPRGMGMSGGLQRMRSLSGLQQSINMSTEALYSRLDKVGRLSESDEEGLARLAAQQEMVRKGMEEVSRALGERRDVLGRLEDIIEGMRDVEQSMRSQELDERVLRRQNQILSRLLDAQKSVQQRDYSGKRYSRPGRDFPDRASPPGLPEELLQQSERLELQVLRERTERYPETYRELVQQYLRELSKEAEQ